VASPATVIRYTGNWKGSFEGWLMTPATGIRQLPAILPGLKDFYMVGQWISPGGSAVWSDDGQGRLAEGLPR